jgi:hypothetical protein
MKTRLLIPIVAGFVIGCGSLPLRANLIANGSFETPVVPVGAFTNFGSGSTGITGWTVVGATGGVSIVSGTFSQECCTFPAEDGAQWLDLTGDGTNSIEGVEQSVATTPGTTYDLSFWVGNTSDPGGIFGRTSTVNVLLGGISGTLIDAATNIINTPGTLAWQQFTTSFTATGSSTTLDFLNGDSPFDNSNGLDNVSLTAAGPSTVPEPATLPLVGVSLAALSVFLRRRRSN